MKYPILFTRFFLIFPFLACLSGLYGQAQVQFDCENPGYLGESAFLTLLFNPSEDSIFIPEAFTPNSDGFNDSWQVQWIDGIDPEDFAIEVYNRSHGLVYRMQPLDNTWRGTSFSGSPLAEGVYWWRLYHHKTPIEAGGVTIRR